MLNIKKRNEEGRRLISGDNWLYDLGQDDIVNILKEAKATLNEGVFNSIVIAFHLGIVAGAKLAKKQAEA